MGRFHLFQFTFNRKKFLLVYGKNVFTISLIGCSKPFLDRFMHIFEKLKNPIAQQENISNGKSYHYRLNWPRYLKKMVFRKKAFKNVVMFELISILTWVEFVTRIYCALKRAPKRAPLKNKINKSRINPILKNHVSSKSRFVV